MAEIAFGGERERRAAGESVQRSIPSQGWITLLLHILIIGITANSVLRVDQGDRSSVLVPLAAGGLVLGFALARTPALDAISHLLALLSGGVVTLLLTAVRADGLSSTWHVRGRNAIELADRLVSTQFAREPRTLPDSDLLAVIGLTLWLIGYSSAWMLYRRHWLAPALIIPATIVFISLRFDDAEPKASLAVLAAASLIMAARHQAFVRQVEWSRVRMPSPQGVAKRFTASGAVIAVIALLAGWILPVQAPSSLSDELAKQVEQRWNQVTDQWDKLAGKTRHEGLTSGTYPDFPDSFRIGGQITPTEDPVATLRASEPTYLALRRFDRYDGHTWSSDVDKTFQMDGEPDDVTATNVTFGANQSVALSGEVNNGRVRKTGEVTVLMDKGGLLFTTETFLASSTPTITVLGWTQFEDRRFDLESIDLASVPIDLQALVGLLRRAEFAPDPSTGKPVVVGQALAKEIEREQARLLAYPVATRLEYDEQQNVMLVASGRLPNYDDIEAVFVGQGKDAPRRYLVTGSKSVASAEQLRNAGTDYPAWVEQRYLQLPTTVTQETIELAAQVIADAGATNPFDAAWAIQEYLRNTYQYAINSDPPPSDRDAIDFFLFGKRIGRCEDYAGAMVVMLRSQGIPARLVGGYRASREMTDPGTYLYRDKLAHTWVEVFFPSYGWVPFEPTAGQEPFTYGAESSPELQTPELPDRLLEPTPTPEPTAEPTAEATPMPVAANTTPDDESGSWSDRLSSGLALVSLGLTVFVALIVAGFVAAWAWGLRGLRPAASLYARAIRVGRLWGVEPEPTMTPHEFAAEFGRAVPRANRAVRFVADLYTAEQYGGIEVTEEARTGGQQAWHTLRSAILGWRPWRRRRRR